MARIKARDFYTCQDCRKVTPDGEVDHIMPQAKGGTDQDSNLQYLCKPCHQAKSQREARGESYTPKGCDAQGNPRSGWSA